MAISYIYAQTNNIIIHSPRLLYLLAQILAKGDSIVEATLKLVKNGSYTFALDGGTSLRITVDVAPCPNCEHKNRPSRMTQHLSHNDPPMRLPTDNEARGKDLESHCTSSLPFLGDQNSSNPSIIEKVRSKIQCTSYNNIIIKINIT